jgi:hypothetical protein
MESITPVLPSNSLEKMTSIAETALNIVLVHPQLVVILTFRIWRVLPIGKKEPLPEMS